VASNSTIVPSCATSTQWDWVHGFYWISIQ
jgi:hypothetical protein